MSGIIITLLLILFPHTQSEVSMLGIKIHDSEAALTNIKLEVLACDKTIKTPMVKYRTENGNDFSVTTKKGKVVYMENDWMHEETGKQPLVSDFVFGQTSLKDIRASFGFNGFTYKRHGYMKTKTHLVMFNCFELSAPRDVILSVITAMPLDAEVTEETVADNLKLEALVLGDKKFLDEIWGDEKLYDAVSKKVSL